MLNCEFITSAAAVLDSQSVSKTTRQTERDGWTDSVCVETFSETLRALSISSFLVIRSLGLHCKAPALVTRPVQLKPSSPTCFLM